MKTLFDAIVAYAVSFVIFDLLLVLYLFRIGAL